VLADFFGQRDEQRVCGGIPAAMRSSSCLTGGEAGQAFVRRRIAFVGNIVGTARETVDCLDRPAQVRGDEEGGNGEVFVVIDGHRPRSIGSSRRRW
jgi:hypothetical protein